MWPLWPVQPLFRKLWLWWLQTGTRFYPCFFQQPGRGKLKCPQAAGHKEQYWERREGWGPPARPWLCPSASSWVWLSGNSSQVLTRLIFSHKVENSYFMWDPQIFKPWQLIQIFNNEHCRSVVSVWELSWSWPMNSQAWSRTQLVILRSVVGTL